MTFKNWCVLNMCVCVCVGAGGGFQSCPPDSLSYTARLVNFCIELGFKIGYDKQRLWASFTDKVNVSWHKLTYNWFNISDMFSRTTTTASVLLINVCLKVKSQGGSNLKILQIDPHQWPSRYLQIFITILSGWDLHFVLFSHFKNILLLFVWKIQDFLLSSFVIWGPTWVAWIHYFGMASIKRT